MRGRSNLNCFLVGNANQPTLASLAYISVALFWVFHDGTPGENRILVLCFGGAVHVHQDTAGIWVADAGGGVGVPGK